MGLLNILPLVKNSLVRDTEACSLALLIIRSYYKVTNRNDMG